MDAIGMRCQHCGINYLYSADHKSKRSGRTTRVCSAACALASQTKVAFTAVKKRKREFEEHSPAISLITRDTLKSRIDRIQANLARDGVPSVILASHVTPQGSSVFFSDDGSDAAILFRFLRGFGAVSPVGRRLQSLATEAATTGEKGFITALDTLMQKHASNRTIAAAKDGCATTEGTAASEDCSASAQGSIATGESSSAAPVRNNTSNDLAGTGTGVHIDNTSGYRFHEERAPQVRLRHSK